MVWLSVILRGNKQLGYCRETALQDKLVMAKSGRLEMELLVLIELFFARCYG